MLLWAEEELIGQYLSWNLRTYSTHEYVTFFLDFIYFCFLCVLFYCIFIFIFLSFLFFSIQMALRNNFYFRRIVTKYSEIWAFRVYAHFHGAVSILLFSPCFSIMVRSEQKLELSIWNNKITKDQDSAIHWLNVCLCLQICVDIRHFYHKMYASEFTLTLFIWTVIDLGITSVPDCFYTDLIKEFVW